MLRYVVRRLFLLVPILLGVSILIFFWVHALPGDPASALLGERATPELVQQYKETYGLDRPLPVQYWDYLKTTVKGDLGTSITSRRTVASEIQPAVSGNARARLRGDGLRDRRRVTTRILRREALRRSVRQPQPRRLVDRHLDPDLLPGDHPQVHLLRSGCSGSRASDARTCSATHRIRRASTCSTV